MLRANPTVFPHVTDQKQWNLLIISLTINTRWLVIGHHLTSRKNKVACPAQQLAGSMVSYSTYRGVIVKKRLWSAPAPGFRLQGLLNAPVSRRGDAVHFTQAPIEHAAG